MEERRPSILRWLLFGAAIFLFIQVGLPLFTGKGKVDLQPLKGIVDDSAPPADKRVEATTCDLTGTKFKAQLTTKGAALSHFYLDDPKYHQEQGGKQERADLVTKDLADSHLPLRTGLRAPEAAGKPEAPYQVAYDDFDWKLDSDATTASSCVFRYEDDTTTLVKTIAANDRPYELTVALTVTNKAKEARTHRLTIENDDWRRNEDTQSGFAKRQSEYQTEVEIYADSKMTRWNPSDFEPKKFEDEDFTAEKWRRAPGDAKIAAVSSSYFTKALLPMVGPAAPAGETRIQEHWDLQQYPDKEKDPNFGHLYRTRLNYGMRTLAPGESANYQVIAFAGPKERSVLAQVGGGDYPTTELLNLGYFGVIGKVLIRYLYFLFRLVGSWGWAICLLTITVKMVLFPLSIAQIKSTMAMRKLKPEMDAINAKYKDDAQQRGLALQELWRKNKVANPMLGCLPVLLQMPVWWALYQALQTAVELYHVPFGPFIPDLSAPGNYYIIPALLGASSWLQQQLMPMQGDPAQQRMMKWMMPAIFTVMMLFLPAGLGIYFLTNTWLGILQQLAVERYYKSSEKKDTPDEPTPVAAFGKGKGRVEQRG
jgi:YidC/Oxa1 family membrane protein insertase